MEVTEVMVAPASDRRGRDLYARLRPVMSVLERIVGLLPRAVVRTILVRGRNSGGLAARAFRFALLRRLLDECGELVDVREAVHLHGLAGLKLGSRISIHPMCYIDATGGISIGDDCSIAHGVTIMSTSHNFDDVARPIRDQGTSSRPVWIGSNTWIGAGARILGGVTVGDGAVVAAGAVVVRDIPDNSVAAGVPARVLKSRGAS